DSAGMLGWAYYLAAGGSEVQVEEQFLTSPEYQSMHATDQVFVEGLYQDVLGRTADTAGEAGGVDLLQNGASRSAVALDFLTSEEFDTRVVEQYYTNILNRSPDSAGFSAWVAALRGGMSLETVAVAFLSSAEYQVQTGGLVNPTSIAV